MSDTSSVKSTGTASVAAAAALEAKAAAAMAALKAQQAEKAAAKEAEKAMKAAAKEAEKAAKEAEREAAKAAKEAEREAEKAAKAAEREAKAAAAAAEKAAQPKRPVGRPKKVADGDAASGPKLLPLPALPASHGGSVVGDAHEAEIAELRTRLAAMEGAYAALQARFEAIRSLVNA